MTFEPMADPCDRLVLDIWVDGVPISQGSKVAVGGRLLEDRNRRRKLKVWRGMIEHLARAEYSWDPPRIAEACALVVEFRFERPKSHLKKNGELRKGAPLYHVYKPDQSKLVRAIEDALTDAEIWVDDSQVIIAHVGKDWGTPAGAKIEVWTTDDQEGD